MPGRRRQGLAFGVVRRGTWRRGAEGMAGEGLGVCRGEHDKGPGARGAHNAMGTRGDGHGEGLAGWGEGHCGGNGRWMEMGDPELEGRTGTQRERGARRGWGQNSDSRMLRTCTKKCPTTKTARGGVRTRIAAGPCQSLFQLRYNSNCAFRPVFCISLHHGFHCVPSWSYAKFTCTINCHIDLASL